MLKRAASDFIVLSYRMDFDCKKWIAEMEIWIAEISVYLLDVPITYGAIKYYTPQKNQEESIQL